MWQQDDITELLLATDVKVRYFDRWGGHSCVDDPEFCKLQKKFDFIVYIMSIDSGCCHSSLLQVFSDEQFGEVTSTRAGSSRNVLLTNVSAFAFL